MENLVRYEIKPTTPEELESTLHELNDHVELAFNVEDVQAQVNALVRNLHEKRSEMRETIRNLERTKNSLKLELQRRDTEEEKLNRIIFDLQAEMAAIEQSIAEDHSKIEKIQAEKEKLSVLMGSLKTAIEEMREKLVEL